MTSPTIICCGLSCLDLQLHETAVPQTLETVTTFSHTTFIPGGCAPQTATALASLDIPVAILSQVGCDPHGETLRNLLTKEGVDTTGLQEMPSAVTSLSILPLFSDGRRGCFVTLGVNLSMHVDTMLTPNVSHMFTSQLRVFHFGYPHLMPKLQGSALRHLFNRIRDACPSTMLTLDVNGANCPESLSAPVILPALSITTAIHANLEEACIITGLANPQDSATMSATQIRPVVEWFVQNGAGIACITCGKDGLFIATANGTDHQWAHWRLSQHLQPTAFVYRPAYIISPGVSVNASGAGDAFVAGLLSELSESRGATGVLRLADAGLVSALNRIDSKFSTKNADITTLLELAKDRPRITPREDLQPLQYCTP